MEATYKTLYSDVGREDLETWLRLGLVKCTPHVRRGGVLDSGKWLAALRSYDGMARIITVYDTKEEAAFALCYMRAIPALWLSAELWHVVDGCGVVEHMRREPDGNLCSIRWDSRVV